MSRWAEVTQISENVLEVWCPCGATPVLGPPEERGRLEDKARLHNAAVHGENAMIEDGPKIRRIRGGDFDPTPDTDFASEQRAAEVSNKFVKGTEIRSVSRTGGEKGTKPQRYDLIPVRALAQIAEHYGVGALKYADNQWRKGYEWSKSYAALQRHANAFWAGEDFDEETGSNHMAAVAWHALTLLTFFDEHPDFDDRFKRE